MQLWQRTLIILFATFSLSACIPLMFVAGATVGGAVVYDKRSVKVMTQDHNAALKAINAINKDPAFKDKSHISVSVFNQIALLIGQANTPELRDKAYEIVSKISHIKRIYNEITIGKPASFKQRSHDTWITTKVKSAMLVQKGLRSSQIKVVTEAKVVYLLGNVSRSQAALAADTASKISGVAKVVKIFTYPH